MRSAGIGVLLALAVVLAGCPADGGPPSTVTPAPVPTVETVAGAESTSCDVPTPPAPPASPPNPDPGPAAIPLENGTVNASALLARHEAALSEHRYRLTTAGVSVAVAQNRSAFLATASSDVFSVTHYAVDGRRYTYYFEDGGRRRYGVSSDDGGTTVTAFGDELSLTGAATIRRALAIAPHRIETVRADDWTVLRATAEESAHVEAEQVREFASTILVDERGIVRSVEMRIVDERTTAGNGSWYSPAASLRIDEIDSARFERPDWVCTAAERGRPANP